MSIPLPFRKPSARDRVRQEWIDERRREARMVVADMVHHSDYLVRLACNVLVQHGETSARMPASCLSSLTPKRPGGCPRQIGRAAHEATRNSRS